VDSRRIIITGRPGVGKTTLVMRVLEALERGGIATGGFYTKEIRRGVQRVGFSLTVIGGPSVTLASMDTPSKVRVGKYYLQDMSGVLPELEESLSRAEVLVIDEVGPMEMAIPELKAVIDRVLRDERPSLLTVHRSLKVEGRVFEVTTENRNRLLWEILNELRKALGTARGSAVL